MELAKSRENLLSREIILAAVEVQRELRGPGLLESVYEEALAIELGLRGYVVARQQPIRLFYKRHELATPLRLDLAVENCVVVECKAVEKLHASHSQQTRTYLYHSQKRLGLVINFGQMPLRPGIKRVANNVPDEEW